MSWKPVNTSSGLSKPGTKPPIPVTAPNEPAKGFFDKLKESVKQTKRQLQETFDGKPIELDAHFNTGYQEFLETEKAFLQLRKHLDEYIKSIKAVCQIHLALASDLMFFYDKSNAHRSVAEEYLAVQGAFNSQHVMTAVIDRCSDEIAKPIEVLLAEFPVVKSWIEKRKTALADRDDARKQVDSDRKKQATQPTPKGASKLFEHEERLIRLENSFAEYHKTVLDLFDHYQAVRGPTIDSYFSTLYSIQSAFFEAGHEHVTKKLAKGMSEITVPFSKSRGTISIPPPSFLNRELPQPKSDAEDALSRGWTPAAQQILEKQKRQMYEAGTTTAAAAAAATATGEKKYYPNPPFAFRKSFAELHYSFDPNPKNASPSANRPPPPPPPTPTVRPVTGAKPTAPALIPILKPSTAPAVATVPTTPTHNGSGGGAHSGGAAFSAFPTVPVSVSAPVATGTLPSSLGVLIPIKPGTAGGGAGTGAGTGVAASKAASSIPRSSLMAHGSTGLLSQQQPSTPPAGATTTTAAATTSTTTKQPPPRAATLNSLTSIAAGNNTTTNSISMPNPHSMFAPPPPPLPPGRPSSNAVSKSGSSSALALVETIPPPPPLPPGRPNRAPTVLKNQVKKLVTPTATATAGVGGRPPPPPTTKSANSASVVPPPPPPPPPADAFGADIEDDSSSAAGSGGAATTEDWSGNLSQGRSRSKAAAANSALISPSRTGAVSLSYDNDSDATASAAGGGSGGGGANGNGNGNGNGAANSGAIPTSYVTATFDYTAQRAIELSFATNDRLWLVERDDESGWWQVMNDKYETGWIPSNYTDQTLVDADPA